jgi:cation diffusion facilitator CzcD-associated flavoprotein CzcO
VFARKVVVAAGITHFGYLPPFLAGLPREYVSHSSQHYDLSAFRGKKVAVI